jgi:SAM-dependent methyltransferase
MSQIDSIVYTRPQVTQKYTGHIPDHWGQDLIAVLPRGKPGAVCLDFGCGDGRSKALVEAHGYRWVGLDIEGEDAAVIGDGHYLPFPTANFDLIISNAVFEHLYDPFQAAREISRVLKPGGTLLGDAAFLEPFHSNSYFHMTHLGVSEVLKQAGLDVLRLWPTWHVFEAQNRTLFPLPFGTDILQSLTRGVAWMVMAARAAGLRLVWQRKGYGAAEIQQRLACDRLKFAGSVAFLARRPASNFDSTS